MKTVIRFQLLERKFFYKQQLLLSISSLILVGRVEWRDQNVKYFVLKTSILMNTSMIQMYLI